MLIVNFFTVVKLHCWLLGRPYSLNIHRSSYSLGYEHFIFKYKDYQSATQSYTNVILIRAFNTFPNHLSYIHLNLKVFPRSFHTVPVLFQVENIPGQYLVRVNSFERYILSPFRAPTTLLQGIFIDKNGTTPIFLNNFSFHKGNKLYYFV